MMLTRSVIMKKYTDIQFSPCFKNCRRDKRCQSFEYNEVTSVCFLYDVRHLPALMPYMVVKSNQTSFTYKLCLEGKFEYSKENPADIRLKFD